jgi:hypothetical protein
MPSGFAQTRGDDPGRAPVLTSDAAGNVTEAGTLAVAGSVILAAQGIAPLAAPGTTTLYSGPAGTVSVADPAGLNAATISAAAMSVGGATGAALTPTALNLGTTTTLSTTALRVGSQYVQAFIANSYPTQGAIAETAPVGDCEVAAFAPASGVLHIASIYLPAGVSVGHIGFVTNLVAANGPTHTWVCLLDATYTLRATSADLGAGAVAASTWFSLAVGPYVVPTSGRYYLGIMNTSTVAQPTLCAASPPQVAMITGAGAPTPLHSGLSTAALTVPGTPGVTVYAAPNGVGTGTPYLYAAA